MTKLCELLRGGLADVGVVGGTVYPTCKVLALLKDYVSVIRFSNTMQCEKTNGGDRVMWGKVRKPLQSNKLIMISRVPGYGRFEYLVLEYHCESQHVTSNKSYWVFNEYF